MSTRFTRGRAFMRKVRITNKRRREMTTQLSCKERINQHLQNRIDSFNNALEGRYEEGEDYEDFIEWLNCYSLAYSEDPHYRAMKLELSWGGPADFFLFFEDGAIEYHFQDWFDGARVKLCDEDLKVMEQVREYLGGKDEV